MRTIEDKILDRLNGDTKGVFQLSCRDRVNVEDSTREYYLWYNRIYFRKNGREHFCFCNWSSNTTKSRLNSLVKAGYFFQKNWKIYFVLRSTNKTYPIDTSKTYAIDTIGVSLLERVSYNDDYVKAEWI
jgi:hypothetical protein